MRRVPVGSLLVSAARRNYTFALAIYLFVYLSRVCTHLVNIIINRTDLSMIETAARDLETRRC